MTKPTAKRKPTQVYAFIDTNIFLDFYRHRNDATLKMLDRLKPVRDRLLCTYQVEMEFLKNRQRVLLDAYQEVGKPVEPKLPSIFADSATSGSLKTVTKTAAKKTQIVKKRILKLMKDPKQSDPVYVALEDRFQSPSEHLLTRDMPISQHIKRLAFRRFMLGYPPRKNSDTSIGDAINWEWIVHCATKLSGKFILVSRDADFGATVSNEYFLNDALKKEFRDRVGKKSLIYTQRLSDALKELHVNVSDKEIEAESDALERQRKQQEKQPASAEFNDGLHDMLND